MGKLPKEGEWFSFKSGDRLTYRICLNGIEITVHGWVGYGPDDWFVSCSRYSINCTPLTSRSGPEACNEAIDVLLEEFTRRQLWIRELRKKLHAAING